MKKKILLISAAAGTGHIRAAEALQQTCEEHYPDIISQHIDLLDYSDWIMKKTISSGYTFIARRLPKLYGLLYRAADISENSAEVLDIFLDLFKINVRKFNKFVKNFNPDHVVCTYFLAPPLLEKKLKNTTIDSVMTDYDINNVCLSPVIRYFFTPAPEFSQTLKNMGKDAYAFGMPLMPGFKNLRSTEEIKKDWPLRPDWPTILITSGGLGLNNPTLYLKDIFANLKNINVIVVTGRGNKKQHQQVAGLKKPENINLQIIEYTSKFDELEKISDVIVAKPGGLTTAEALYLKKPLLVYSPIPGQEEANVKFLEKNNFGLLIRQPQETANLIKSILKKEKILSTQETPPDTNKKIIDKVIN